ncbi:NACHT domain-containing protein [Streptomyces sp. NPDC048612]|uniref:NACHT domain-containing protein n=1 Tax=Streptomyces sp. NPDC048612 TaxID=3365579 RepID=UPI0037149DD6
MRRSLQVVEAGEAGSRRHRLVWRAAMMATGLALVLCAVWVARALARGGLAPQDQATVVGLLVAVLGAVPGLIALRRRAEVDLTVATDRLALHVKNAESGQWQRLLGQDRMPIDIGFAFRAAGSRTATPPDTPAGRLSQVADDFSATRPRRLVITGEPGSGKTVLAVKLLLALLNGREPDDPVPVRLSLAGWDTTQPFTHWLAERLVQDYDRDPRIARELVADHRIVPVLDGLDEMDSTQTPLGASRSRAALRALDAYQDGTEGAPFVLTCRSALYDTLTDAGYDALDTARIDLEPVTPAQAITFLESRRRGRPERWQTILDTLRTCENSMLARALSTPWRLTLTAVVFADSGDPADLLAHSAPGEVDAYLLERYLPAAARMHPTRPEQYTAEETARWLGVLARHLAAGPSGPGTDLVLHRLWPVGGRRRVRIVERTLALFVLLPTVFFGFLGVWEYAQLDKRFMPLGLIAFGVAVLAVLLRATRRHTPTPRLTGLPRKGTAARRRMSRHRWRVGMTTGVAAALLAFLVFWPDHLFLFTFVISPLTALALTCEFGLLLGIAAGLSAKQPDDVAVDAADPRNPLRDEVTAGLTSAISYGLALALPLMTLPLLPPPDWQHMGIAGHELRFSFVENPALAVACMIIIVRTPAARRYLALLLCTRSHLPWRLGAFLSWARDAGMLRTSGIAYQFRHRELQEWLARRL